MRQAAVVVRALAPAGRVWAAGCGLAPNPEWEVPARWAERHYAN